MARMRVDSLGAAEAITGVLQEGINTIKRGLKLKLGDIRNILGIHRDIHSSQCMLKDQKAKIRSSASAQC